MVLIKLISYLIFWKQLILDELDVVFCGDVERPCTTQDIAELKYLECCIKEALRMYPSIPFVMRNLTEDVEIGTAAKFISV